MTRGAGLIAGSPTASGRPGSGNDADPFAGGKNDPGPGGRLGQFGDDQRAVGGVGIVAGVLDDAGAGAGVAAFG